MSVTYSACTVGKGDPPLLACPCQAPPSPEKPPPPTTGPQTCTITGNGVNYRTGPNTSDPSKGTYNSGNSVGFLCRATGESIDGNRYAILIFSFTFSLSPSWPWFVICWIDYRNWDKTSAGDYVSQVYVDIACASKSSLISLYSDVFGKRLHSCLLQINSLPADSKLHRIVLKLSVLFGVYGGIIILLLFSF
jgi:hypothetical protein